MSNIDKLHELKKIVDKNEIEKEIKPIFISMDQDDSGVIDFKEYKRVRFIIEGTANLNQIKKDYAEMNV